MQTPASLVEGISKTLEAGQAICAIHTLGFTAHHDAAMLSKLTRAGTAQGTFLYLQDLDDVSPGIEIVTELLDASCFTPPLRISFCDGHNMTIHLEPAKNEKLESTEGEDCSSAQSTSNPGPGGRTTHSIRVTGSGFLKQMPVQRTVHVQVIPEGCQARVQECETKFFLCASLAARG